jgi:hypothetical protein
MSIKDFKPSAKSVYTQGYFDKYNPQKYVGPKPIIYRSSLELRYMRNLELDPNVISWSSENIVIPYMLKVKQGNKFVEVRKNYNIDFTVHTKDGVKHIVEVKPSALVPLNESQIKRSFSHYRNASKWKYAIAWCKNNGYEFNIVTEKHLGLI